MASLWERLRSSLARTRQALVGRLDALWNQHQGSPALWDELEEALLAADVGVAAARALVESLRVVPPGQLVFHPQLVEAAVGQLGRAFLLGLRMGAPVLGVLFLTDVALAVVARAVPQLNLFVVGFPVKLGLGLAMVMLALPAVVSLAAAALGRGGMLWEGVAGLVWAMGARR